MNNETTAPKKSNGKKVTKGCGVSLSIVLGLFSLLCFMIAASDSETRGIFIALAILPLIIIFCIIMALKTMEKKIKINPNVNQNVKDDGLTHQIIALHTNGLPIAEGLSCNIKVYTDRVEINSGTTHITLSKEKITDMCVKSETEIQKQYVSSVGGAAAGLALFGPLGAMIGGRAKKKTTTTLTYYLIITYKKADDSLAYIGFDVTYSCLGAKKIVKDFCKSNTKEQNIEL